MCFHGFFCWYLKNWISTLIAETANEMFFVVSGSLDEVSEKSKVCQRYKSRFLARTWKDVKFACICIGEAVRLMVIFFMQGGAEKVERTVHIRGGTGELSFFFGLRHLGKPPLISWFQHHAICCNCNVFKKFTSFSNSEKLKTRHSKQHSAGSIDVDPKSLNSSMKTCVNWFLIWSSTWFSFVQFSVPRTHLCWLRFCSWCQSKQTYRSGVPEASSISIFDAP